MRLRLLASFVFLGNAILILAASGEDLPAVAFQIEDAKVTATIGGQPIAKYVTQDAATPRPYFANLRTLGGLQVTRNHPPREGDAQDHATFHPGLWMAFGDLAGSDNWRLKARVVHERFVEPPHDGAGRGGFTVENRYLDDRGETTICRERGSLQFHVLPGGWLLVWDSVFTSEREFAFGDQEEMGLGVRVATPLAVVSQKGGRILDAAGHRNEQAVRGQAAAWCDYGGPLDGRFVGVTLISHPENFRPSWHHVRDYGVAIANPFGQQALTGGRVSRIAVKMGEEFRLRFGVFVHDAEDEAGFRPDEAIQVLAKASLGK